MTGIRRILAGRVEASKVESVVDELTQLTSSNTSPLSLRDLSSSNVNITSGKLPSWHSSGYPKQLAPVDRCHCGTHEGHGSSKAFSSLSTQDNKNVKSEGRALSRAHAVS